MSFLVGFIGITCHKDIKFVFDQAYFTLHFPMIQCCRLNCVHTIIPHFLSVLFIFSRPTDSILLCSSNPTTLTVSRDLRHPLLGHVFILLSFFLVDISLWEAHLHGKGISEQSRSTNISSLFKVNFIPLCSIFICFASS